MILECTLQPYALQQQPAAPGAGPVRFTRRLAIAVLPLCGGLQAGVYAADATWEESGAAVCLPDTHSCMPLGHGDKHDARLAAPPAPAPVTQPLTAHLVTRVPLGVDQQVDVLELLVVLPLSHPRVVDAPPPLAVCDELLLHCGVKGLVHSRLHLKSTWGAAGSGRAGWRRRAAQGQGL